MEKATEQNRNGKTQAKLAVLPPLLPRRNSNSTQVDHPVPVETLQPTDSADSTPTLVTDAVPDSEVLAEPSSLPIKTPKLQVVGPAQLEAHRQDLLQSISQSHVTAEQPENLFYRITTFLSGWATSFIIHSLLLIALALLTFRGLETQQQAALTLSEAPQQEIFSEADKIDDLDFEPDESSLASELEEEEVSDLSDDLTPELLAAPELEFDPEFLDDGFSDPIASRGLSAEEGKGGPTAGGPANKGEPGKSADFFGAYAEGTNFVFVIDCSGSMTGERWERAVYELERSILELTDEQKFCIVLYNRFSVIMGNANSIVLVEPTEENIGLAFSWLRSQTPSGGTYPRQALSLSLAAQPDAIFLLSDGEIQDNSEAFLSANNVNMVNGKGENQRISVHTIALLSTFGQRTLKKIADQNEGTFTRVGR